MSLTQDTTSEGELLEQQRVLAEFGEYALRADDLDAILSEACRLLGRALKDRVGENYGVAPRQDHAGSRWSWVEAGDCRPNHDLSRTELTRGPYSREGR